MPTDRKIKLALLIMRLGIGSFLAVWTSLKFIRPEWMVNVFRNTYGLDWITADYAYGVGTIQALLVLAFVLGIYRTLSYSIIVVMHGTGVVGALLGGGLLNFAKFPNNLLWTSVATLAALVALWILRDLDEYTVDGQLSRR